MLRLVCTLKLVLNGLQVVKVVRFSLGASDTKNPLLDIIQIELGWFVWCLCMHIHYVCWWFMPLSLDTFFFWLGTALRSINTLLEALVPPLSAVGFWCETKLFP
jgi:hypothetical protein